MPLVIGPGITIEPGINIEASNTPLLGRSVAWTNNTYLDFGSARSGITTSNPNNVGGQFQSWQMCYAWQSVQIANGTSTLGFNSYINDISLVNWYLSIATAPNTLNFTTSQSISYSPNILNYTAGSFVQNSPSFAVDSLGYVVQGPVTIPANTYFMIGMYWPAWRTWQTAAQNVTAYVGTTPYVTAMNTVYTGNGLSSGGAPGVIPAELGGTAPSSGNFLTFTNTMQVMSAAFSY